MNQSPLVTLAVPTYQGEKFLEEALSTAIAQTYNNIEIIISDDGSLDDTLKIATAFQEKSAREFKIFSHERLGLVHNWNFCVSMSRGEYIKFLFQDDLLLPNCVEAMVALAVQDEGIGLVFSPRDLILSLRDEKEDGCMTIYEKAASLHENWSNLRSIQSGLDLLNDPDFISYPLNKIGEPSTVLIKKEVFETLGPFDDSFSQLIDVDMWTRIMTAYKVAFIDEKLSYFRIHPGQQTLKNIDSGELSLDFDRFFSKLLTHSCYANIPQTIKEEVYRRKVTSVEAQRDDTSHQLNRAIERMDQLERETENFQTELQKTQQDYLALEQLYFQCKSRIEAMETSKFWKARKAWFKLKRSLNLPVNE
ncbi:MAG: hypothetical protein N5P05_001861 [Chroococcopsis gigantea SAG 12.99]|jgi:glycosyltransferase involved in cell wall biosynthesis|nr:glycosyltransferase [Chlorogloea purpurea SAG 13.99]MDV3000255.1 hypothetical protein [Chroococcopsis gigantea SAG 12.99]